MSRHTS